VPDRLYGERIRLPRILKILRYKITIKLLETGQVKNQALREFYSSGLNPGSLFQVIMDKFTKEAEDMPALSVPCKTGLTKTWSPVQSAHEVRNIFNARSQQHDSVCEYLHASMPF